jgi:hypothetical protein
MKYRFQPLGEEFRIFLKSFHTERAAQTDHDAVVVDSGKPPVALHALAANRARRRYVLTANIVSECHFILSLLFVHNGQRLKMSSKEEFSSEVGFQNIFLHHALGVEMRSIERDAVAHDAEPIFALLVKGWQDDLFQLFVSEGTYLALVVTRQ